MASAIDRSIQLPALRPRKAWSGVMLAFLVFYIIAFPKGGIKAGGVPLTIGYVLTTFMLILAMLRGNRLSIPFDRMLAFLPCLLLGLWSLLVLRTNGTDSVGFTVSYFVSVFYLPLFGLVFFSALVLDEHCDRIEGAFLWAIRFIVLYGIFLFLFKQVTGQWIEIPYITVNVADVGQLDDKYINRGGIFKLISTYNNGNIFGVCLAIMAPLYLTLERRKYLQWAFYAAMFLTLSRTVWIAAILIIFMRTMSKGIRPLSLLYLAIGLLMAGSIIVVLLNALGVDVSFIFDSRLGGRANQLNALDDIRFIPEGQIGTLPEIVYLGVLEFFGIPGLLLFVAHLLVPPLLLRIEGVRLLATSPASACLQGLLIYAVVAGADAAFSFIPVMMVFWMVAGWGFWYAHRQALLTKGTREASC
jgi:hypothetical protein